MSDRKKHSVFHFFLNKTKNYPVLAAVGAGLYPLLFYYSKNLSLIDTWAHLGFFVSIFLALPLLVFVIANWLFQFDALHKWQKFVLPFLNVAVFLILLKVCLYAGLQRINTLIIVIAAGFIAFFLYKHLKKLIVIQFLMALMVLFSLIPTVYKHLTISDTWTRQPDAIAQVVFQKKPNVYLIQPDGYVNFSELRRGYYNHNNPDFENQLGNYNFTTYPEFRSNYATTLSSNSATFMMKHHYYGGGNSHSEGFNGRRVVMSKNTVLEIFKNNGYKTHFISEKPYLLLNKPRIGYDEINFENQEIPYLGTGLKGVKDIRKTLHASLLESEGTSNFFFIQFFNPGHIANRQLVSEGVIKEKAKWFESLRVANQNLDDLISMIQSKDPEGLIIIMADHGGFVGMNNLQQIFAKTTDRDLIYSIFSSQLSIYWPNEQKPNFDTELKTPVNLFRIIFSYLSEDKSYLLNLQENSSFAIVNNGAPEGVYKYIDESGNITFSKQ